MSRQPDPPHDDSERFAEQSTPRDPLPPLPEDGEESSGEFEFLPTPGAPQGSDVVLVLMFVLLTWVFSAILLLQTGFFVSLFPEATLLLEIGKPNESGTVKKNLGLVLGPAGAIVEGQLLQVQALRLEMWARALVFPVQLLGLFALLRVRPDILPEQIGLALPSWPRALFLVLLGWLVLTPVVLGFNHLVTELYTLWTGTPHEDHSLMLLTRIQLWNVEWFFWFFLAVVVAPVLEEYFFRGMLQSYLLAAPWRGYFLLTLCLVLAFWLQGPPIARAAEAGGWERLNAYLPILFLLLLGMLYLMLVQYANSTPWSSYVMVSMIFAVIHTTWPQPVALFVLSLGLCYLRQRSGTLVVPVLVHGLFNATSAAIYFLFSPG